MEAQLTYLVVILLWSLTGTVGNQLTLCLTFVNNELLMMILNSCLILIITTRIGSVVLTQTHPAAPYVCRTGNITLRCQYDGVENVLVVLWTIGGQTVSSLSTFPGHTNTALPNTTALSFQELVVDSFTNLVQVYRCVLTLSNGSQLQSNAYSPQIERECYFLYSD